MSVLAAEFYRGSTAQPATLKLTRIADGRRTFLAILQVRDKAEARKYAKAHGATPWNF